ncbi:MAG: hypothetical protein ACE5L7_08495 [Candidatus Aminicenantales bacterium]
MPQKGIIEKTPHVFPAKWFAKRIPTGLIANSLVVFTAVRYREKYLIIHHTQDYQFKLFDLEKNTITTAFRRKYRRVRYRRERKAVEKIRPQVYTLGLPIDYHNDIQKIFIHKDRLWVFTSTWDRKKGVLVDVFNSEGHYMDNFYLSLQESI